MTHNTSINTGAPPPELLRAPYALNVLAGGLAHVVGLLVRSVLELEIEPALEDRFHSTHREPVGRAHHML